jgi:hypothetical protein
MAAFVKQTDKLSVDFETRVTDIVIRLALLGLVPGLIVLAVLYDLVMTWAAPPEAPEVSAQGDGCFLAGGRGLWRGRPVWQRLRSDHPSQRIDGALG